MGGNKRKGRRDGKSLDRIKENGDQGRSQHSLYPETNEKDEKEGEGRQKNKDEEILNFSLQSNDETVKDETTKENVGDQNIGLDIPENNMDLQEVHSLKDIDGIQVEEEEKVGEEPSSESMGKKDRQRSGFSLSSLSRYRAQV